jgi:hypothetical protein
MKKKTVSITLILIIALSLTLITNTVFAGNKNQNDETNGKSVEKGTGKINGQDGCRPDEQSGNFMVYVPTELPPGWSNDWEGGPCCPSNFIDLDYSEYPFPNQCCNAPDYYPEGHPDAGEETGEHHPGNHCLCFALREWPRPPASP